MHAVMLREFGAAENLSYEEVDDPVARPGEMRIAAEVSGVHLIEAAMREGLPIGPPLPELPTVFGSEVAGVVDAVGDGVDPSWLGTRVVTAAARPGGYAELAAADVTQVRPVPDGVSAEVAVAMIRTGATALGMLDLAGLTDRDMVLVTSAAGGIGRLLVRYAHRLGARVAGVAGGAAKVAAVRALGADAAVDYTRAHWPQRVRDDLGGPVSVVFDGVGGDTAEAAFGLLADRGRMITIGSASRTDFAPDPGEVKRRDLSLTNALAVMLAHGDELPDKERRALDLAARGEFVPTVQAFRLADAAAAHAALESRATTGKVVLLP